MILLYIVYIFACLTGGFIGYKPFFRLDKLTKRNVLNTILLVLFVFTGLLVAYNTGFFPQFIAAPFMVFIYLLLAGFFSGYAIRLMRIKSRSGALLYSYRSFWTDHAPAFLSIVIILFGLYRTGFFTDEPVTAIRLSSGLSLICFGFLGWFFKVVPDFRSEGIILLDQLIKWKHIISWRWHSEDVLKIEYLADTNEIVRNVKEFLTSIPEDERVDIETILRSKMEEFEEERNRLLTGDQS